MNKKVILASAIIASLVIVSSAAAKGSTFSNKAKIRLAHQAEIAKLLKNASTSTSTLKTKIVTLKGSTTTITLVKPGKGGWSLGWVKKGKVKTKCVKVPPGHLIAQGWFKTQVGKKMVNLPPCQKLPRGIANQLASSTTPVATTTTPVATTTVPAATSTATTTASST